LDLEMGTGAEVEGEGVMTTAEIELEMEMEAGTTEEAATEAEEVGATAPMDPEIEMD